MDDELFDDIDNLDRDPELAMALGNMVVAWASAETAMAIALSTISGMTPNMALLGYYRIPTFEARNKYILSLMAEWHGKGFDKEGIRCRLEKLRKLASTRNHWVHNIWSIGKKRAQSSPLT